MLTKNICFKCYHCSSEPPHTPVCFQTTLSLIPVQHSMSFDYTRFQNTDRKQQEMPEQRKLCMAKTKLLTFLQESLLPPVPLCHSFLYRNVIFDDVFSLDPLPRTLFQNPAASVVFLPYQFCSVSFYFLLYLSQHTPSCQSNTLMLKTSLFNYSHHISLFELHWQPLLLL